MYKIRGPFQRRNRSIVASSAKYQGLSMVNRRMSNRERIRERERVEEFQATTFLVCAPHVVPVPEYFHMHRFGYGCASLVPRRHAHLPLPTILIQACSMMHLPGYSPTPISRSRQLAHVFDSTSTSNSIARTLCVVTAR